MLKPYLEFSKISCKSENCRFDSTSSCVTSHFEFFIGIKTNVQNGILNSLSNYNYKVVGLIV